MLQSTYSVYRDVCVVQLEVEDLEIPNLTLSFLSFFQKSKQSKIILNLSNFAQITSRDFLNIEKIVKAAGLNNYRVIVCEINPYSASLLVHFIDKINFETRMDVKDALDALSD